MSPDLLLYDFFAKTFKNLPKSFLSFYVDVINNQLWYNEIMLQVTWLDLTN